MYSAIVLEHFQSPRNLGSLEDADAVGQRGMPGEGPYVKMALKMNGTIIVEARYETYGCPSAIACGSWLTEWVKGKSVEQASSIQAGELMLVLGGLPLGKEHAAQLAIGALQSALSEWAEKQGEAK